MLHSEKDHREFKEKYKTVPGNYSAFYDNIFDAMTRGAALAVKPEEALQVIRIIEDAQKSNAQQKTIQVNGSFLI